MHSHNLKVKSTDLTTYFGHMIDLLWEPALQNFASSQRAIVEINKVHNIMVDGHECNC